MAIKFTDKKTGKSFILQEKTPLRAPIGGYNPAQIANKKKRAKKKIA